MNVDEILHKRGEFNPIDYFAILNCDASSNNDQIRAEYRQLALRLHPDKQPPARDTESSNPSDIASTASDARAAAEQAKSSTNDQFALIQRAYQVLLDPQLRSKYEQWYRSGLQLQFESWLAHGDSAHSSVHWQSKARPEPAIESHSAVQERLQSASNPTPLNEKPQRSSASLLQQFRNYQI
ncbi:hypothetical protein CAOG_05748 [Capsaspora owczarzaki ATCC 30864]|uniref:J domain-containing protein n=1 Tax=Capsaspora owczarzaki (strain ATCC 30864) TaxID=595528 RepID=A0A0D2UJJ9_CAPO3|nr:hypothetical protein CAOG_05748 [Capsaspora owczarzaki ATCC 30864]KJE95276.1 hypothetical protein CAOG_005748 [Capsaspora owczarzaki ATCC 30864]|eukprot:XP_004346421.1 hypothetical protein CAOG_05748 [Capsaspora owczarzaki ATCC 30864]